MAPEASKVPSADQFTAWQIHYAEFAQFCCNAASACEEASHLIREYGNLCHEQQQHGFSATLEEQRQKEITSSKKMVVEALANNMHLQTHNSEELHRFQASHEKYAEELEAMQNTLSEAAYLDADDEVESYLDFLFASVTVADDAAATGEELAQRVEEKPPDRDTCIICMEEIPEDTTPCPLAEGTQVVRLSCCRQIACRVCLETFWDTNNDNKIACPVCRKVIGD